MLAVNLDIGDIVLEDGWHIDLFIAAVSIYFLLLDFDEMFMCSRLIGEWWIDDYA